MAGSAYGLGMPVRNVQAPDGRDWVVRRRWAWRSSLWEGRAARSPVERSEGLWARFRRRMRRLLEGARFSGHVLEAGGNLGELGEIPAVGIVFLVIAVVIVAAAVVLFGALVLVPLLLAILDLAVLLVLAGLGLLARLVFRRPWTIDAHASDGTHLAWKVAGWRASSAQRDEVAQLLSSGITPPGAVIASPAAAPPPPTLRPAD